MEKDVEVPCLGGSHELNGGVPALALHDGLEGGRRWGMTELILDSGVLITDR